MATFKRGFFGGNKDAIPMTRQTRLTHGLTDARLTHCI
jgi:hypothetical protein